MLNTCLKTDNLPLTIMGLCPLLIVTTSTLNAVVMGSIFLTVLLLSGVILSLIRHLIPQVMRLSIILLVTACVATLVELLLSAFYYEWHLALGIYIPLLSMNCLILVNAEENVLRNGLKEATGQILMLGVSIIGILFLVGLIRDTLSGLIFSDNGFILFEMVPGAFLALGLIIALLNYINMKNAKVCD
jgi:electron transport complex protein RnfE